MRLKKSLPAELHNEIVSRIKAGKTPGEIKAFIASHANISLRTAHDYYKHVQESLDDTDFAATVAEIDKATQKTADIANKLLEPDWKQSLLFDGKYIFNKEDDKYIVYLRSANRHIVVPGDRHRAMLAAYSNWDGNPATINEICRNFEFPRAWFIEYKTLMGWTHDREPITNEELKHRDEDDIIQDLLQRKRFSLYQKFQKEDWKNTQEDATKWREFQTKQLNPFETALSNWTPPTIPYIPRVAAASTDHNADQWFVCGCFDWQIGAGTDEKYLFRQKPWDTNLAKQAVEKFAYKVVADIASRNQKFQGCEILLGGDLHHGFHGYTAKGTKLIMDSLKEEQFDALLTSLTYFIGIMQQVFGTVNVRAVRGNHDGFDFYPVMKAVEAYFRAVNNITFYIYTSRTALFRIWDVLVLLDHGASDSYKSDVPKAGKARESYIQSLLLAHPEKLQGVKQKIFVQGDKHHYEQTEYNDFEFFMFGALPLGDKYADDLNLHSRPRQNCLIINRDGVKEVLHYYFD